MPKKLRVLLDPSQELVVLAANPAMIRDKEVDALQSELADCKNLRNEERRVVGDLRKQRDALGYNLQQAQRARDVAEKAACENARLLSAEAELRRNAEGRVKMAEEVTERVNELASERFARVVDLKKQCDALEAKVCNLTAENTCVRGDYESVLGAYNDLWDEHITDTRAINQMDDIIAAKDDELRSLKLRQQMLKDANGSLASWLDMHESNHIDF